MRHGLAAAVLVGDQVTDTITLEDAMDMQRTLEQVRSILEVIDDREQFMKDQIRRPEPSEVMRRRILYNMRLVNALVDDGRKQLDRAQQAVGLARMDDALHRAALDSCEADLLERQRSLDGLMEELVANGYQADALKQRLSALELAVAKQEAMVEASEQARMQAVREAGRVWYAQGTARELRDRGVISRSGAWGILGKRHPARERKATFTEVQRDELDVLPLKTKRATLLTEHPEGSYRFKVVDGRLGALEITDPEQFWAYTRYLIVEER